jgi:two-component system NtrC family sensor kinase
MFANKFLYSLTGKLILTIGTLIIIISFVFWYATLLKQEHDLKLIAVKYGDSFIDFIKESTRHNMLAFRRSSIQQTLQDVSNTEGLKRVMIFDHKARIFYSSNKEEVGNFVDKGSISCVGCHLDTEKSFKLKPEPKKWDVYKNPEGFTALTLVEPIYNESACYTSECHVHSKEQKILGFVEADMSLALLDEAKLKQGLALTAYVFIFIVAISISTCIILYKVVTKPVSELAHGMAKVAMGDLEYHLPVNAVDEFGDLARTFNAMTNDLKKAKQELVDWGNTLEKKVQEKTKAIKNAQAQLIHSEKLASLGRMAAGVAHEINSPLTGIVTFGHLLQKKFQPGSQDREDIDVIIDQANRCSNIIKGLLGFARSSAAEKSAINIHDVINSSLNIVRNKVDFFNLQLITDFDESLPGVTVDSSQLQQVFLNMIMNAADAIEGKGSITIKTNPVTDEGKDFVEIEFRDTGTGISEDDLKNLFEPFFTTKPVGKGTGLGLAVSHGIIQEHGGKVFVKTKVGEGTSFFIRLPAHKETA